jgi:hypothetical protein
LDDIEIGLELINKKKNRRSTSMLENKPEPIVEENIKIKEPKPIIIDETSEPEYKINTNINENAIEVKEPNLIEEDTINNIKEHENLLRIEN